MRVLLSHWTTSFVGVALLAALAWVFGPLLPPFDEAFPRALAILGLAGAWFFVNLLVDASRRGRDRALTSGVARGAGDAASEEERQLGERLTRALEALRKATSRSGYLYEQPWYVIIGPPGAGKTTALLNAGLRFPLADAMGQGALSGVGGTRMCDWWFTDQAVLIDTAGRYTTQDSDARVDAAGWTAFLDLLRRARPRQPLNGVIVAIGLPDIAEASAEERLAHAAATRARLHELEDRLGLRLPVYLLFTKADLLSGFTEFFDDLDKDKRAQVLGSTFPRAEVAPVARFSVELEGLIGRLSSRLFGRLDAERNVERRALALGFPSQLAAVAAPLREFVVSAFGGTSTAKAPMLRGFYFASGTQEGTPFDRLTGALARAVGIDTMRTPTLRRTEQGRSYFLQRLLSDVIFGEAMLVAEPPERARGRRVRTVLAHAAMGLLLAGGLAALWRADAGTQHAIDVADDHTRAYVQIGQDLGLDPVAEADAVRILPMLDAAAALAAGEPETIEVPGLSQAPTLRASGRIAYRDALLHVLLPRLVLRVEQRMRGALDRPDPLYEATRIDLMLGGEGVFDRDAVRNWVTGDWADSYPGDDNAPVRAALARHLDALLALDRPPVPLDGALIDAARAAFAQTSPAARIYARIRDGADARALPQWRPADALGALGAPLFVRATGRPLTEGVPGFFTPEGSRKVLRPALAPTIRRVAQESWVLGHAASFAADDASIKALGAEVMALYVADYAAAWDAMLDDLNVTQARSVPQAAQDVYVLAAPESPMRALLVSLAAQLSLADAAAPADAPERAIDTRYAALRTFVGKGPGAPMDVAFRSMVGLQQMLAKVASLASSAPPAGADDPGVALRVEAFRQPPPVSRWMQTIAASSVLLKGGGARQLLAAAYNAPGGPAAVCKAATAAKYPFVPGASDASLAEFTQVFGPGRSLDSFFNLQLRPYVDTTGETWKPVPGDGTPAIDPPELAQFQRAARIRESLFGGGAAPSLRLDVTPVSLAPTARSVRLDLDGTVIGFDRTAPEASTVVWPAPGATHSVRVTFDPPPPSGPQAISEIGPWALFRLIADGKPTRQPGTRPGADRMLLTFRLGDRQAQFAVSASAGGPEAGAVAGANAAPTATPAAPPTRDFTPGGGIDLGTRAGRASSVQNPLDPGMFSAFKCPTVQ